MRMRNVRKQIVRLLLCGVLAGEIGVLVDLTAAWMGTEGRRIVFLGGIAALALILFCVPWFTKRRLLTAAVGLPGALAVAVLVGFLFWKSFSENARYRDVDSGKELLYAGHKVMLIVPHEDDEVNLLGGVMEEYVKYGSEVYPVFITNGDYEGQAENRFAEAVAVAEYIGIPKENVIFLGYGDQWKEDGPHIYNAQPGVVMESYAGRTETYGTETASVFREGRAYTIDNLMEDLQTVILTYRPDTIYCSDYDSHIDHKATTLLFEKVMGRILKEGTDYRPGVYKGYAYSAAWYSVPDYYTANILSTCNVFADPLYQQPAVYRWEERIRLPVSPGALSRSICSSGVYQTLALHASQEAITQASRVINGDRVVWQRETDSLCYTAEISASSGSPALLNDFMLTDNYDLMDTGRMPYDGTWIPDAEDTEKTVTVSFPEPVDIAEIVLYDHPSEEHNVLNAVIRFDDGSGVETGRLDPGGAATRIRAEKSEVSGFTITLTEVEGEQAGLTEVEAFRQEKNEDLRYIKLMDEEGQFVYDYWTDKDGQEVFSIFSSGIPEGQEFTVSCDNARCSAVLNGGMLNVNCPVGETAVITVSSGNGEVSDSVCISNPGAFRRLQCTLGQKMEEVFFQGWLDGCYRQSVTYELLDILCYRLEHWAA